MTRDINEILAAAFGNGLLVRVTSATGERVGYVRNFFAGFNDVRVLLEDHMSGRLMLILDVQKVELVQKPGERVKP